MCLAINWMEYKQRNKKKKHEKFGRKKQKKILEDGKKSLGASQLLFDGGLFILSNLGNLCGALEGLVKATEFGDKKGAKRQFPPHLNG